MMWGKEREIVSENSIFCWKKGGGEGKKTGKGVWGAGKSGGRNGNANVIKGGKNPNQA